MLMMYKYLVNKLTLLLTDECNLRCSYCFIHRNGANMDAQPPRRMTVKDKKKLTDMLLYQPGRRKSIEFFGGEPLLMFDEIREAITYARKAAQKAGKDVSFCMSTNGALLDRDKLSFLLANGVSLSVSIDGTRACHDMNRKLLSGEGSSYDLALGGIPKEMRKDVTVNYVISRNTCSCLADGVRDLVEHGFDRINISPDMTVPWEGNELDALGRSLEELSGYYMKLFGEGAAFTLMPIEMVAGLEEGLSRRCHNATADTSGRILTCKSMLSLADADRERLMTGSIKSGIDGNRRRQFIESSREKTARATASVCGKCDIGRMCFCKVGAFALSGCDEERFLKLFQTFCRISGMYIMSMKGLKDWMIATDPAQYRRLYKR